MLLIRLVVVSGVDTEVVEVDYSSLTATKKGKINAFANLPITYRHKAT